MDVGAGYFALRRNLDAGAYVPAHSAFPQGGERTQRTESSRKIWTTI
jgi:hypothetical protein